MQECRDNGEARIFDLSQTILRTALATVQGASIPYPYGGGLRYSSGDLELEVDIGRQRVVRYDPRDLSHVYLERPKVAPLRVPLRDSRAPPLSLWELKPSKGFRGLWTFKMPMRFVTHLRMQARRVEQRF
jgi:hypothetical protein